jgi:DedD protein
VQANIKQRILGFVVIIALAIVLLPMMLDGDNGRNIAYQTTPKIPPRDIQVTDLDMPSSTKLTNSPESKEEADSSAVEPNMAKPKIKTDALEHNKNITQTAKLTAAKTLDETIKENQNKELPSVDKSEDIDLNAFNTWVIQVGSFSNRQNAQRLQEKLRHEKFKVFIRTQKSIGKLVNVVYVGQYKTKKSATEQVEAVEKVAGLNVIILPFEAVTKSLQ